MSEHAAENALLAELAEAVANALADRPQRCGHSSDPMCCPYENFPTLAEFFDPDEDSSICGADEGFGICSRPSGHKDAALDCVVGGCRWGDSQSEWCECPIPPAETAAREGEGR